MKPANEALNTLLSRSPFFLRQQCTDRAARYGRMHGRVKTGGGGRQREREIRPGMEKSAEKRKNREKTKKGGKGIKQARIKDRDVEKAVRV